MTRARSLQSPRAVPRSLRLLPRAWAEPPFDPIEIGSIGTPGIASGVSVVGTLAYVADGDAGLRVIDISNSVLPVELGFIAMPDRVYDIAVVGTRAYVADGSAGLRVIDVPEPGALLLQLAAASALLGLRARRRRVA